MVAMTSAQISAELQRKKNLGINPTNTANQTQYNSLTPQNPAATAKTNSLSPFGGADNYAASQNNRWQQANESGNKDLMSRLQGDSQRVGYTLNPYTPKTDTATNTNTSTNSNPTANDYLALLNEKLTKQSTKEIPQFNYDFNTDPLYQAANRRADAAIEQQSGDTAAYMNRRGILNSTITGDRLAQIGNAERAKVSDTLATQLIPQAYQRYRDSVGDQLQSERNQMGDLKDLFGLTNGLDQQGFENRFNYGQATGTFANGQKTLESEKFDYNKGIEDRNYNYQIGRDDVEDSKWVQQFNEEIKQNGITNAINSARESRISSSGGGSGGSGGSNSTSITQLLAIWKASGVAPEGIPGVSAGTKLYDEVSARKAAEETGSPWDTIKGLLDSVTSGVSKLAGSTTSTLSDEEMKKYLNQ